MAFRYRGVVTKVLYSFATPLLDTAGHPVVGGQYSVATYNGETVVVTNNDGSVARGTAGPVPPGANIYNAYTVPSPWEQQ